jgi:hypothetical protein
VDAIACAREMDRHQTVVRDLLARKEALIRASQGDAEALSRLRWELIRAFMAYQMFKHREIFDAAASGGTPDQVVLAKRLKVDCIAMGAAHREYTQTWSLTDVADRWPEYQSAALAMIETLRVHLAAERRETQAIMGVRARRAA